MFSGYNGTVARKNSLTVIVTTHQDPWKLKLGKTTAQINRYRHEILSLTEELLTFDNCRENASQRRARSEGVGRKTWWV